MRQVLLVFAIYITSSICLLGPVFAGGGSTNGGNVLICEAPKHSKVELQDFYEARELHKRRIYLGSAKLPFLEKVEFALKRLERLNPNRANLYRQWTKDFIKETAFVGNIATVSDVGAASFPESCKLVQIAEQQEPILPGDFRYLIRKSLWERLDEDNKAGLILHELIYREARNQQYKLETSKFVRYFNGYISSDAMNSTSLKEYIDLVQVCLLQRADAQRGVKINTLDCNDTSCGKRQIEFYSDDIVKSASRSEDTAFTYRWRNYDVSITGRDSSKFNPDGSLMNFEIYSTSGYTFNFDWIQVTLPPASAKNDYRTLDVTDDGQNLHFSTRGRNSPILFQTSNDAVKSCHDLKVNLKSRSFYCY